MPSTLAYADFVLDPGFDFPEGPQPTAHVTLEAIESGSWGGAWNSRPALDESSNDFGYALEWDFGTFNVDAGKTVDRAGFSILTPQLDEAGTASITHGIKIHAKLNATLPALVSVSLAACLYRWNQNNTATIFTDKILTSITSTSYNLLTITAARVAGIIMSPGDRYGVDLWLRVANGSATNYSGRWGYVKFGDSTYNGHMHHNQPLHMMPRMMSTAKVQGAF